MAKDKEELLENLKQESLRYTTDTKPGFFRQRLNGKFHYYDKEGSRIKDSEVIDRIDKLGIPPAWKKVWIAPYANGHLQATGLDEKKRKQYIYHSDWTRANQQNKFSEVVDFGLALPKIRSSIRYHMGKQDMSKAQIIATVVWLLEHTFIRIGNEEYSKENKSYGLTTLRNRHVTIRGKRAVLNFIGKSGKEATVSVQNPTIVKTLKRCVDLPGFELFQYIDEKNKKHTIDSQDVNEFLKDITQGDFTAKDFRTWGASHLSANHFFKLGHTEDAELLKQNITSTVKKVAEHLNNTVSVCRNYYIHPTVIATYQSNILPPHFSSHAGKKPSISGLDWEEEALITLLKKHN